MISNYEDALSFLDEELINAELFDLKTYRKEHDLGKDYSEDDYIDDTMAFITDQLGITRGYDDEVAEELVDQFAIGHGVVSSLDELIEVICELQNYITDKLKDMGVEIDE